MAKLNEKDLIEYVIENGTTLMQAAEYFGVSLSTVKKTMKKVRDNLSEESEIYKKLRVIAEKNEALGKKKGGKSHNSGVKRRLSLEEISILAMNFIAEDMTFSTASEKFGISSSTLWENFKLLDCQEYKELYNDLLSICNFHNKGITEGITLDVIEVGKNFNDGWLKSIQNSDVIKLQAIMQKYKMKLEEVHQNKKLT